jgi:hypothetical protein
LAIAVRRTARGIGVDWRFLQFHDIHVIVVPDQSHGLYGSDLAKIIGRFKPPARVFGILDLRLGIFDPGFWICVLVGNSNAPAIQN